MAEPNATDAEYYEQLMQFYNETIAFESKVFSASDNVRVYCFDIRGQM